jgi:hypothetical protein
VDLARLGRRGVLAPMCDDDHPAGCEPRRVVDKDGLLRCVWAGRVVEEANIHVQVNPLRRILGRDAIATVQGIGYQLVLDVDVAPLGDVRAAGRLLADLPAATKLGEAITPLVGRDADVQRLQRELQSQGLVTLIGPGGVGKTRLSAELARELSASFADGVIWVDLTAADKDGVALAIASAARMDLDTHPPAPTLIRRLRPLNVLLVLDNAEMALDALRPLLPALAQAAPGLRVLVTSQRPVGYANEQLVQLRGLAVAPPGTDWAQARLAPAVQMLLNVVHRADPDHLCNLAAALLLDARDDDAARVIAEALPMLRRAGEHGLLFEHVALLAARLVDAEVSARVQATLEDPHAP